MVAVLIAVPIVMPAVMEEKARSRRHLDRVRRVAVYVLGTTPEEARELHADRQMRQPNVV
jgi:hypothetical protein